ncbi:MAG TPA: aminotransferase class V-fold PLP-dependent enzyme [Sphingomicrobium sp.]|nr:aminotransferase class V-fold PLP-dependent enzyme [Sphingomicrobium sp.]
MSFKRLFSRSLGADPGRLHLAAHSHHLWPDASHDAQVQAWNDAASLADRKWDKVMDQVWPEAQAEVAAELDTGMAEAVVFSSNTHDFLIRLVAAAPRSGGRLRVLTTDGEFHSARRQFARWAEDGWFEMETVAVEPFATFSRRFLDRAQGGGHDLILVSQVLFNSGQVFDKVDDIAAIARVDGPWVVIDGYHAFMAVDRPFSASAAQSAFYLGGGYKYAMAGEGCAFLHAPPGFGERPPVTGWFAEFGELTAPPGGIGYTRDAMRFMGATFDPSALYRFTAVQQMLADNQLTTAHISAHVSALQQRLLDAIADTPIGYAELLNPLTGGPHARFLAFRSSRAQQWCAGLKGRNCITDVRGDVLRIGLAIYHDAADIDRFAGLAAELS